jgi:hypothetical protein
MEQVQERSQNEAPAEIAALMQEAVKVSPSQKKKRCRHFRERNLLAVSDFSGDKAIWCKLFDLFDEGAADASTGCVQPRRGANLHA